MTHSEQKQWNETFFHQPTQSNGIEHNWASSRKKKNN